MRNRLTIWIIIILLLVISSPGLINRWSVEVSNNNYELVAPYEEIYEITKDSAITIDEAFRTLKEAGLTTISLSPLSLYDLERHNIIAIFDEVELSRTLQFAEYDEDFTIQDEGYYISIPNNRYYNEMLLEVLKPDQVTIFNQDFYFVSKEDGISLSTIVGYDELVIKQIENSELSYLLRAENTSPESNQFLVNSLLNSQSIHKTNLLFTGEEVLGYPETNQYKEWAQQLTESGYSFYSIEFSPQKGLQTIARTTDYNIIRLHSINLAQKSLDENINQAVRAIKERNIRSVIFHFQPDEPEMSLENAVSFIKGVNHTLPKQFEAAGPVPFKEIEIPSWITIIILVAGILFTYICTSLIRYKWLHVATVGGMAILGFTYIFLDRLILLQAFALGISVIAPTYAVLSTATDGRKISIQYAKALGINLIGIVIVVGLLNGNAFITGFEIFRGVKLLYLLPILLTGVFLFLVPSADFIKKGGVVKLLNTEVKYWHLLLFLLVGAIGFYYLSRSGNGGSASEIELLIRHKLEEYLYVRPRTKEFLIGFPLYIFGLYLFKKNKIVGKLLLLGSVIGFLSMMNTFTHFHIPLYISFLRTAYSILLGYVIGMIFIYLYKTFVARITKHDKKRWI